MQRFPWGELMRLGIGRMCIPPREFWNCTLRELVPLRGSGGISRVVLDQLMMEWPDD